MSGTIPSSPFVSFHQRDLISHEFPYIHVIKRNNGFWQVNAPSPHTAQTIGSVNIEAYNKIRAFRRKLQHRTHLLGQTCLRNRSLCPCLGVEYCLHFVTTGKRVKLWLHKEEDTSVTVSLFLRKGLTWVRGTAVWRSSKQKPRPSAGKTQGTLADEGFRSLPSGSAKGNQSSSMASGHTYTLFTSKKSCLKKKKS